MSHRLAVIGAGILLIALSLISSVMPLSAQGDFSAAALKTQAWLSEEGAWLAGVSAPFISATEPALPATTNPTDPAIWNTITFQSYRNGNWEIYVMRSNGDSQTRLTTHPASDVRPRLNRGATRVAFVSYRDGNAEIYAVNPAGGDADRLTKSSAVDTAPSWSPDGASIAFSTTRDGNSEIYTMNASGEGLRRLTDYWEPDYRPSWSPDGTQIAWIRIYNSVLGKVWVMNADGSNAHEVSDLLRYPGVVAWSPDGARLAMDCDVDHDEWNEIVVLNADGSNAHTIYDPNQELVDARVGSWSADGKQIVFSRIEYINYNNTLYILNAYVETVRPDGGDRRRWTDTGYDMEPDWQSADIWPPDSHILPLPALSRADGFILAWNGADRGPAGLASYDLQVRDGAGPWQPYLTGTSDTATGFAGTPGRRYAFRLRARDYAGLVEPWQDNPDVETTFYSREIAGTVRDVRDYPLPDAQIQIAPAPLRPISANALGDYHSYLTGPLRDDLRVSRPGYASSFSLTLNVDADTMNLQHYLAAPQDSIVNGGFETGALGTAWQGQGSPAPAVTTSRPFSGQYAATLGQDVAFMPAQYTHMMWMPMLALDQTRTMHVLGVATSQRRCQIVYANKTLTGSWSNLMVLVGPEGGAACDRYYDLEIDPGGGMHLVWRAAVDLDPHIFYCYKRAGSTSCGTPADLTQTYGLEGAAVPRMMPDGAGGIYVTSYNGYLHLPRGGNWSPLETVQTDGEIHGMAMDAFGTLHFVFNGRNGMTGRACAEYCFRRPDGSWSPMTSVGEAQQWTSPLIAVTPDGTAHMLWHNWENDSTDIWYASRSPGGAWSPNKVIHTLAGFGGSYIGVDESGRVHVIAAGSDGVLTHLSLRPSGEWRTVARLTGVMAGVDFQVDAQGNLFVVWSGWPDMTNLYWTHTAMPATRQDFNLAQNVVVPADMHRPTLSFVHSVAGLRRWQTPEILVTDGQATTPAESHAVLGGAWEHVWADMGAWAGRTVTLTLRFTQEAYTAPGRIFVDDVTLGPWLTPVIESVEPASFQPRTPITVTLRGENFVPGASVTADQYNLYNVTYVDQRTLVARLLLGLQPGLYAFRVQNPGGARSSGSAGVQVGTPTILPLLQRGWR